MLAEGVSPFMDGLKYSRGSSYLSKVCRVYHAWCEKLCIFICWFSTGNLNGSVTDYGKHSKLSDYD